MNNKYIYLPISALVVAAIGVLVFEIPKFSLMIGFASLLQTALGLTFLLIGVCYLFLLKGLKGEDLYIATGSSILFGFVISFAIVSYMNRQYANKHCAEETVTLVHYEPRYASAYGKIEEGKIEPNQWVLTVNYEGQNHTFTLRKSIMDDDVTNPINLEFCKGILGTKYLKE